MEISIFEELCDLTVTDQIKQKVPPELKEHFFGEFSMFKSSNVNSEKLDAYENVKRSLIENQSNLLTERIGILRF